MSGDANYASVVLLLHCDDAAFPDTSSYAHTVANEGATCNTSRTLFGAGSLQSESGSSCLRIADAPELDFSTGDWTIEAAFYLPSAAGNQVLISKRDGSNKYPYTVRIDGSNGFTVQGLDGGGISVYNLSGGTIDTGRWVKFAVQRHGSTFTLFMDGVSTATASSAAALAVTADGVTLGGAGTPYGVRFAGELDEIRFTKGVARYTTDYVPAPGAFADSVGISFLAAYTDANKPFIPLELWLAMHSIRTIPGYNKRQLREQAYAAQAAGEPWIRRDATTKQYYARRPKNN